MENKWKSAAKTNDAGSINFAEEKTTHKNQDSISVRNDWTLQRKAGVAMGVVGVLLFVVGLSPMVLDSDSLKGSVTSEQEPVDPILAALGVGATGDKDAKPKPAATDDGFELPSDMRSFGTQNRAAAGNDIASATSNIEPINIETPTPLPTLTAYNAPAASNDPMQAEVKEILSAEQINAGTTQPLPTAIATPLAIASNTNIGTTDTTGSAFGNIQTVGSVMDTSDSNAPMHGAAGLQNTSAGANQNLHDTGPAGTAALLFLLSLFLAGGIRYRKELF